MVSTRTYFLLLIAVLVLCFGLGAALQPRLQAYDDAHGGPDNVFKSVLGESSRVFANSFYVKADAYYHSGYYPTIFDNARAFETPHIAADTGAVASHNQGDELGFMGPPRH